MVLAWLPVIGLYFIRERPSPTKSEDQGKTEAPTEIKSFRGSIRMIAKNKEFWLTTLLLVFQIGLSWSIMTLIGYFSTELKPVAFSFWF
jgi:hypothetical protein